MVKSSGYTAEGLGEPEITPPSGLPQVEYTGSGRNSVAGPPPADDGDQYPQHAYMRPDHGMNHVTTAATIRSDGFLRDELGICPGPDD